MISPKTRIMCFGINNSKIFPLNIKLHSVNCDQSDCQCGVLEQVHSLKYLGIVVDESLSWSDHCDYLVKRCRPVLRQLYLLRNILPHKNLIIVYNALFQSIITYCITVWGNTHFNKIKKIKVLQNSLMRIIFKKDRLFSADPLYVCANVLPIRNLYVFRALRLFFMRGGLCALSGMRHGRLRAPRRRTEHFGRGLTTTTFNILNNLPIDLLPERSEKMFTYLSRLRCWLLEDVDDVDRLCRPRYS